MSAKKSLKTKKRPPLKIANRKEKQDYYDHHLTSKTVDSRDVN